MRELITQLPSLDERAAQTIATAMRMVADADGAHPRELALIEEFERELETPPTGELDLFAVDAPELRDALLKSLVLVAFADGRVSDAEGHLIGVIAQQLGVNSEGVRKVTVEVAGVLISQLAGAKLFRADVVRIGKDMGLSDAEIRSALGDS